VTPRFFAPRQRVRVGGAVRRADRFGRLHVALRLGPANRQQALTPGAVTRVFGRHVTFAPVRG
jgi:hypothetical protein